MDTNRIKKLLEWEKTEDAHVLMDVDCDKFFFNPLLESFGDDINEILKYLNNMDIEELDRISGVFENIYEKFMTDDVYDALEKLGNKLKAHGYQIL